MSFKCKIGLHSWNGCKCSECEKTRDEQHDWSSDCAKCSTCGKIRYQQHHSWHGCKCSKCGKISENLHDWNGCKCTKCGETRNNFHDLSKDCEQCCVCGKRTQLDHTWDIENLNCKNCSTTWRDLYHKLSLVDLYTIKNEIENITSNLSAFNIRTTYDPLKRINQCIQYNSSYRKKNIERISIINRFNALVIEASLGKAFEKSPGIWSQDTCIVYIWKVKDGLAFTSLCPRTELFPKGIVPEVFKEIDFTPKEKRSLPTLRSKRIGNQEWLSENLNVAEFSNGDTIKMVLSDEEWKIACKNREPAWCYYENDSKNGNKYGKLYNWYAVNDNRLLAPVGWHIPSYYEWKELISFLGGSEIAGGKMKSQLNWSPGYLFNPGSNLSGLSCLPGGKRLPGGSFENEGRYGYWWSTEEDEEEENGWYKNVYLYYDDDSALQDSSNQGFGLSVRCIKDK